MGLEDYFLDEFNKHKLIIKKQKELIKDLREELQEATGKTNETILMVEDSIEYFHLDIQGPSTVENFIEKQEDPLAYVSKLISDRKFFNEFLKLDIYDSSYSNNKPYKVTMHLGWFQFKRYDLHYIANYSVHYHDKRPELNFVQVHPTSRVFIHEHEAIEHAEKSLYAMLDKLKTKLEGTE